MTEDKARMSDIVERLQRDDLLPADYEILCVEAADEIERLRTAIMFCSGSCSRHLKGGEDE